MTVSLLIVWDSVVVFQRSLHQIHRYSEIFYYTILNYTEFQLLIIPVYLLNKHGLFNFFLSPKKDISYVFFYLTRLFNTKYTQKKFLTAITTFAFHVIVSRLTIPTCTRIYGHS